MGINLDLKDRKILYELDKDCRLSNAQIGKKTGLSSEVVFYRIKKLEEKGIISQYQTSIDYHKLDLTHFKVCLKFNGISLDTEERIYSQFKNIPQIIWIAKCQGEWDCIISCTVNSIPELDEIKDRIISISSDHISNKSISILNRLWVFPRRYLTKQKEDNDRIREEEVKLDDTDIRLLRILSKNARKPVVEIVKELDSTVKIITTRIRKLKRSGVINQFRLVLDYERIGLNFFKTFIYIKNPDEKRLKQLIAELNSNPNVVINIKVIGEWDLEPEFEFETKEEFQKTIQHLKNRYSDMIQKISVIDIAKEYKYTFFYK